MDCCASVRGSECHCGQCHQTLSGLGLFEVHQDVDYSRDPVIVCRDPAAMRVTPKGRLCDGEAGVRLVQDARGTWCTPDGLKARERSITLLATARSSRTPPTVLGDPDCPFCHGDGDCLECDPETAWK